MNNTVVVVQDRSNGVGTAGFVLSLLGWLTCGLLCIPGALLSFLGLFSRGSKGLALAGLIVGFPGVLFFVFIGAGLAMSLLGIGAAVSAVGTSINDSIGASQTHTDMASVESEVEFNELFAELPDDEPPPIPPLLWKTFADASGRFRVEAAFISTDGQTVTLKRRDNGAIVTVQIDRLASTDQAWILQQKGQSDVD